MNELLAASLPVTSDELSNQTCMAESPQEERQETEEKDYKAMYEDVIQKHKVLYKKVMKKHEGTLRENAELRREIDTLCSNLKGKIGILHSVVIDLLSTLG